MGQHRPFPSLLLQLWGVGGHPAASCLPLVPVSSCAAELYVQHHCIVQSIAPGTYADTTLYDPLSHLLQIPNLDAVLQTADFPCVPKHGAAVPIFGYQGSPSHYDLPFPDYAFWGHEYQHLQVSLAQAGLVQCCAASLAYLLESALNSSLVSVAGGVTPAQGLEVTGRQRVALCCSAHDYTINPRPAEPSNLAS